MTARLAGHRIKRLQPIESLRALRSFDHGRGWLRPTETLLVVSDWDHGLIVARSRDHHVTRVHVSWEQIRTYCELLDPEGVAIDPRPFEERSEAEMAAITPAGGSASL